MATSWSLTPLNNDIDSHPSKLSKLNSLQVKMSLSMTTSSPFSLKNMPVLGKYGIKYGLQYCDLREYS